MDTCYACKQPLKKGQPHKVSDCAEALHRALDLANVKIFQYRDALEHITELRPECEGNAKGIAMKALGRDIQ